jgi:hypothetical protein
LHGLPDQVGVSGAVPGEMVDQMIDQALFISMIPSQLFIGCAGWDDPHAARVVFPGVRMRMTREICGLRSRCLLQAAFSRFQDIRRELNIVEYVEHEMIDPH